MDFFLVSRGVKTLAVRMDRHNSNGMAVAKYLEAHPKVKHVIFPGWLPILSTRSPNDSNVASAP